MTKKTDLQILKGLPAFFPYWLLRDRLQGYSNPAARVAALVAADLIVRIRRGFYCLGEGLRTENLSLPYVACRIHRNSVVSLQWALAEYGLIPESVCAVTSVTPEISEEAVTPIGVFYWKHIPKRAYGVGVTLSEREPCYFITTPEKALADLLWTTACLPANNAQWNDYIFEDLRIDEEGLGNFSFRHLTEIAGTYGGIKLRRFLKWWERRYGTDGKERKDHA